MQHAILVVDDNHDARRALVRILERTTSYKIHQAHDPVSALTMAMCMDIALVLTDLRMPGGGGAALLELLRAHGKKMPVVLLTGSGTDEADLEGFDEVLQKPVTLLILIETLARLIGRIS